MNKVITESFTYQRYNIHYKVITHGKKRSETGILFLHGKNTHSDYFMNIIEEDKTTQFSFFAFDYPCQGRSSGKRGNCNLFKTIPGLIKFFIENIVCKYGIKQLYIIGESLGSLIGFYFINEYQIKNIIMKGIVFIPGVFKIKTFSNKLNIIVLFLLSIFIPWFSFKSKTTFSFYTKNPDILKKLQNDNYYSTKVSAKYMFGLYRFYKYLRKNFSKLSVPIIIFQGKKDHYSSYGDLLLFYNQLQDSGSNKIVFLEKSNHWLLISEEIQVIKEELYNWLGRK